MKNLMTLTFVAFAALILSSFSIWASVARINEKEVLSHMQSQGLYEPQSSQPLYLPASDPQAQIPQALLEQLDPANSNTKGEV